MTDKISAFLDAVTKRELPPVRPAKRRKPKENKTSIHLRVDADVLEFFKSDGKGHLTRMNDVLRKHMEAGGR